jgi:hypothetical protein
MLTRTVTDGGDEIDTDGWYTTSHMYSIMDAGLCQAGNAGFDNNRGDLETIGLSDEAFTFGLTTW